MEKRLDCDIVLSLEEITLRRVVTYLWNVSIFDSGEKLRYIWDIVEGEVKDKVSKLLLPESLKNRMMNLVRPIGSDILNWQVYHEDNLIDAREVFDLHILQQLRRTCRGAIDYRRTAEELVRLEMFDIKKRFELACSYCLEDTIPLLWRELSEEDKESFLRISCWTELMCYWASIVTGEESYLDRILAQHLRSPSSFYYVAFKLSARYGNKAATEYFFQKLADEERESSSFFAVVDAAMDARFLNLCITSLKCSTENVSDVLCYLLSVMSTEEQMQVFKKYPCKLLTCLLDWPFENLLDIADLCWSFLLEKDHARLLSNIHENIRTSDYYLPNSFQKFFLRSPSDFRKLFVERECPSCSLFSEFLHAEDTETIKVIFRNIDAADRASLVFSEHICKVLSNFILRGRWHIVEVCIREATLSKEDRETLKGALRYFTSRIARRLPVEWRRQNLKRCFEILDEIDASSANKRSAGDETLTRVKKLCSEEEKIVLPRN
ncbi:hypothetical protein AVEN_98751-1 [Araneus ventricosus]|uniref:Uncharacterized protein n=1 Tax=Araneus ventricosus TaxID=182803 RepID=A0A4Y2PU85_ARAVE|nr:hypothetical protein AVEN_98751-1 [Araneus ventricosus]